MATSVQLTQRVFSAEGYAPRLRRPVRIEGLAASVPPLTASAQPPPTGCVPSVIDHYECPPTAAAATYTVSRTVSPTQATFAPLTNRTPTRTPPPLTHYVPPTTSAPTATHYTPPSAPYTPPGDTPAPPGGGTPPPPMPGTAKEVVTMPPPAVPTWLKPATVIAAGVTALTLFWLISRKKRR